jgi:glutamine synthetase
MCEVLLPDRTPHPSNSRAEIADDPDAWFGFEQEYFLYRDGSPLGFPKEGFPAPQGEYYTGVGFKNVGDVARQIVDEHIDLCLEAGIAIEGVNAEVAKGQWEFQVFGKGSKRAADELWIARYLMLRLCERYGVDLNFHPKPLGADLDWNGSGLHTNFSTKHMRETGGEEYQSHRRSDPAGPAGAGRQGVRGQHDQSENGDERQVHAALCPDLCGDRHDARRRRQRDEEPGPEKSPLRPARQADGCDRDQPGDDEHVRSSITE